MKSVERLCTFNIGDLICGIEVDQIQEVMRSQRMTRVPLVSGVVSGLINLRGQIVTALDMRPRVGLARRVAGDMEMNLVVRTKDGPVSLIVDDVGDVVDVDRRRLEDPPPTLKGMLRSLVHGVYKTADELVLILDVEKTAELDDESMLAGASR